MDWGSRNKLAGAPRGRDQEGVAGEPVSGRGEASDEGEEGVVKWYIVRSRTHRRVQVRADSDMHAMTQAARNWRRFGENGAVEDCRESTEKEIAERERGVKFFR